MFLVRSLLLAATCVTLIHGQPARQNPSPMSDSTRPHPRIEKVEVGGKRIPLQSLKGATLFTASEFKTKGSVSLLVHFHGAPWLIERHIAETLPQTALITVQLGAGSSAYGPPFADAEQFGRMIDEAGKELALTGGWKSITLSGFSAGYGAVRAILRQSANYRRISGVLLLDGIHASYEPEGKGLAEGGAIADQDLDSFVSFARDAADGRKSFVLTHSEIFPGTFASTTECVDHLLAKLGLKRSAMLRSGPIGMQQLSRVSKGKFQIFGYAGSSAPDHVDHLHAMPFWFRSIGIK